MGIRPLNARHVELLARGDSHQASGPADGADDVLRFYAYQKKIKDCVENENEEFEFWYDFGDDWQFTIKCENKEPSDLISGTVPFVLGGKGIGIIEDCGGIYGLEDMKKAFKKKSGEEYENYCEWLGVDSIDFDTFDIDAVNKNMKKKIKSLKDMWDYFKKECEQKKKV